MKLSQISTAICLIVLVSQISAVRYSEEESDSLSESLKLKIHQKETIREIESDEPSCSCKHGKHDKHDHFHDSYDNYDNHDNHDNYDEHNKLKEKVFVNRGEPVYVRGKSRHVVVPAGKPIVVKTAAVVIRQKGDVEYRPIHITKQKPPIVVTKKIYKVHRPVVKKYYVEKFRKQEAGHPAQIVSQKISKHICNCPTSEHTISPNHHFDTENNSPVIRRGNDAVKVLFKNNNAEIDLQGEDF